MTPPTYLALAVALAIGTGCSSTVANRESWQESKERLSRIADRGDEGELLAQLGASPLIRRRATPKEFIELAESPLPATVLWTISRCTGQPQFSSSDLIALLDSRISPVRKLDTLEAVSLEHVDFKSRNLQRRLRAEASSVQSFFIGNISGVLQDPPTLELVTSKQIYSVGEVPQIEAIFKSSRQIDITTSVPLNYHVESIAKVEPGGPTPVPKQQGRIEFYQSPTYMAKFSLETIGKGKLIVPLLTGLDAKGNARIIDYRGGGYCLSPLRIDGQVIPFPNGGLVPLGATDYYTLDRPGTYALRIRYRYSGGLHPQAYEGVVKSSVVTVSFQ